MYSVYFFYSWLFAPTVWRYPWTTRWYCILWIIGLERVERRKKQPKFPHTKLLKWTTNFSELLVFIQCVWCSFWGVCFDFLPQGIRFLIDCSLLKNTSEDIAQFLYKGEGLNKTAIGDYLGERWAVLMMSFPVDSFDMCYQKKDSFEPTWTIAGVQTISHFILHSSLKSLFLISNKRPV